MLQLASSKDFEKFKMFSENRQIYQKHVDLMIESISKNGFIKEHPIIVMKDTDNCFKIIDGQHRFTACKKISTPFYYEVVDQINPSRDMLVKNIYSRSWAMEDYLHHYCTLNNQNYINLRKFSIDFEIPTSSALSILLGDKKSRTADFKKGYLNISLENIAACSGIMSMVNDIRFFHEKIKFLSNNKAFISALVLLIRHPEYDHKRMMKIIPNAIGNFYGVSSIELAKEMVSGIYNRYLQKNSYIKL